MAFTKITASGIGSTETVTLDGLSVINDGSFGGNVSVGGTLTYEDVTNVDSVGLITARNGIVVGSGITLSKDGDVFFTGIITGNGSGLTNLATDLVNDTTPQLGGNLDGNGNNIKLGDSSSSDDDRLQIGAATYGDLELYHDGTNSYIDGTTNDLYIRTTASGDDILIYSKDNIALKVHESENGIVIIGDGSVQLYYDDSLKLETATGGVTVTGTQTATDFAYSSHPGVASFTGDNSTTTMTIASGHSVNSVLVVYNGVVLTPTTDYTISGTTLTFTFTPVTNSQVVVRYLIK